VGVLPHVCIFLYIITVQLLKYIWCLVLLHGKWLILRFKIRQKIFEFYENRCGKGHTAVARVKEITFARVP